MPQSEERDFSNSGRKKSTRIEKSHLDTVPSSFSFSFCIPSLLSFSYGCESEEGGSRACMCEGIAGT